MPFRIPMILSENSIDDIKNYNQIHAQDHQDIAGWLNSLANAYGLSVTCTYYSLPIFDPKDKNSMALFFDTNWKQHMVFYDLMNLIGNKLTLPVFTFPRNYPSGNWDMDIESFVLHEYSIHATMWRAIEILKGG